MTDLTGGLPAGHPRVRHGVLVGLGVVVAYAALVAVDDVLPGGGDGDITDPTLAFLRTHVLPLSIIGALLVGFARWSGWWRDVWRERPEQRVPRWWLAFPVLYTVTVAGSFVTADWSAGRTYLLVLLVGTLLVGFTEELALRGILLTGARGSMPEIAALLLTCVVFGAMHALNLLHGAPVGPTLVQIAGTAGFGAVYYAIRRATTFLWPAMLLHALNDFARYAQPTGPDGGTPDPPGWAVGANMVIGVLGIAMLVSVLRERRRATAATAATSTRSGGL
ncbi:CPBP family intramembrane glutamic endopeptidase [Cellulomonas sp. GbtcB1]|uniref:CPBP family intramembrane glutamic endopeptidase n=1 Tax=Cellulomonas sp. GbtcB1 TaxID=2824746 RepID=UPI001C2FD04F|nr:CPBP family intramembrane glutamic endopeptidase [Cellulomonas sp. GbtcB1]